MRKQASLEYVASFWNARYPGQIPERLVIAEERLAGIPIESRFYLFGNATIAQGLFRYSERAGLGAPVRFCVSQRDGEDARIDIDLPTSFFGQFSEMKDSPVPRKLDERMIPLLQKIAS